MHATPTCGSNWSIDDDKTLPLATLAEAVTDQNLEAVLRIVGEPRRRQRRGALW